MISVTPIDNTSFEWDPKWMLYTLEQAERFKRLCTILPKMPYIIRSCTILPSPHCIILGVPENSTTVKMDLEDKNI